VTYQNKLKLDLGYSSMFMTVRPGLDKESRLILWLGSHAITCFHWWRR
jgi:hypothetical protein